MFERILVPLDGSLRSERILGSIARVLRREDSRILLFRVPTPEQSVRESEEYIAAQVQKLRSRGARVDGRVASGDAATEILKAAEAERSTLIAMATHGRSGLSRWLIGSVAEKVVRASSVPVLLIRSLRSAGEGEEAFRRILLPVDGSPASLAASVPALEAARLFGADAVVLHAEFPFITPGPEVNSFPAAAPTPADKDEATEEAAEVLQRGGIPVQRATEIGGPAEVILDQAARLRADLIVMGTHGRSGFSRWALGSVAERVLRHAETAVLLVPAKT